MTDECTCDDPATTAIDGGYRESWEGTTPEAVYGAESFNPYRNARYGT